jgi:hypothetical protein
LFLIILSEGEVRTGVVLLPGIMINEGDKLSAPKLNWKCDDHDGLEDNTVSSQKSIIERRVKDITYTWTVRRNICLSKKINMINQHME